MHGKTTIKIVYFTLNKISSMSEGINYVTSHLSYYIFRDYILLKSKYTGVSALQYTDPKGKYNQKKTFPFKIKSFFYKHIPLVKRCFCYLEFIKNLCTGTIRKPVLLFTLCTIIPDLVYSNPP
jgi:amino acid permease